MKTINDIREALEARRDRSAWSKGVTVYALELLEQLEELRRYEGGDEYVHPLECRDELLNGARDWKRYSWGGSSLIYDGQIAKRLCSPSELRKTHFGATAPNAREGWLDVQARALLQACELIVKLAREEA